MADPIPTKRKYDSSRRQAQAAETRKAIADSARDLFTERGYAGATVDAIADGAGVARETVYAIFSNKQKILAYLLDISIGGDEQPVRLIDRPEPQANLRETDQRRQIAAFAGFVSEVLSRAAPIFEIMRSAGKTEPAIARRVQRMYQVRMDNMRLLANSLASNGPLRGGLNAEEAAGMIWALSSPELYQLMTQYRGWTREQFAGWLRDTLTSLLIP